jgi:hypothetical protein
MRKIIIAMLIALVPAMAFAGVFDIAYGVNIEQSQPVGTYAEGFKWGSFETGYEMRTRIWIFGIDSVTKIVSTAVDSSMDPTAFVAKTDLGLGLSFGIGNLLRLGLGINTQPYQFAIDGSTATLKGFGNYTSDAAANFAADLLEQKFIYKATVDFNLGDMLLGLTYKMPSDFSCSSFAGSFDWSQLIPQFANGTIGLSLLYSFF